MKTFNKIFLSFGVAAALLGTTSCVGDLDMSPVDPSEKTDVSNEMDQVFADIYLNFATQGPNGNSPVHDFDGGMAVFQRALFTAECMPTDEACWLWDPEKFGRLNYGYANPELPASMGFYSRLVINIALCNDFITSVNNGKFNLDEAGQKRAQEYLRQARILRGACYFYMMSFYSNPPYADETTPIGGDFSQPGRDVVYAHVTSDLENVVAEYKQANLLNDYHYAYVGVDAAEAILAKIYLNGEVFAGRNDYAKCYEHSKAVIDRLGHGGKFGNGLAPTYLSIFGANNDQFALGNQAGGVNEIIWTIPASKYNDAEGQLINNLESWGGATFMIAGWSGSNGTSVTIPCPTTDPNYKDLTGEALLFEDEDGTRHIYQYFENAADAAAALARYNDANNDNKTAWQTVVSKYVAGVAYSFDPMANGHMASEWVNSSEGWKCMVARETFVNKFTWSDTDMSVSPDYRVALWCTSAEGFPVSNISLLGDDWGKNGYIAKKYNNWVFDVNGQIDYAASADIPTKNGGAVGGDYAMLRLSEVYLMAAEAILQGGGGSQAEAVKYVNYIRERAYGDNYTPWTSLNMNDLRDERCRELYQECTRRTDLIRWNQWCTGYTWNWKGGIQNGTNLPEYTKSYPIPTRVLTTSSLQQMPGY
ncbi:MAG: RagB/SusD family nutrient uptake outer membrane protein [Muribaculaceae bacterium]|nr:RagB/SusD family nutrient uptake outer membrane protein [Muribaculaceae bacterium]